MSVPFDYLQGNIKQLHLERDIRLVPFGDYPFLTVHLHYFVHCKLFHVHERQGGKTGEDEQVSYQCKGGISKLMRHDSFDFILCQILTLLYIRADVELCKRVSRYQSVIVRTHHDTFQPHAVQPDGGVFQSPFGGKISRKLLDEVGCKFQHGHIRPFVERLDKGYDIVSRPYHHLVCADAAVFAYTFQKIGAILVESLYQCLILAADTLIGVAHHFSRNVCLPV